MAETTNTKSKAESRILYIFTRTPLHVGGGSSVGAIDLPVQRERHSRHPIIPGSSIKGVFRFTADSLDRLDTNKIKDMFGPELTGENAEKEARAGDIVFGEARPLAFPVRSAKGAFGYITCPLALRRFARDSKRTLPDLPAPDDQTCLSGAKVLLKEKKPPRVVLEEYALEWKCDFPTAWEDALKDVISDPVWKEAAGRLILLSDGDFSHFVATTTEISQHIKIDPKTGTVQGTALFNIESVPAETLFFAPIHCVGRPANDTKAYYKTASAEELGGLLTRHPVLQFGGNSTTGRGFCSVALATIG